MDYPRSPILEAHEIRKVFSYPAAIEIIKNVSLRVERGESIAIMGASGEGKSTLLHILGTLEGATSGKLLIAGKDVSLHPTANLRNAHIGFIFQSFNLLEDYTALQNVLIPARIAGQKTTEGTLFYERGLLLLEKVGLAERAHYPTRLLSGGEKQRVSIARALCNDPELLLADEPSGNLDHATSQRIHSLLLTSVREMGKALIVVTHDAELAKLCDKTYVLRNGALSL